MIEGYCMINREYQSKHGKYIYTIPTGGENVEEWSKDRFNPKNWIKEPNPDYDPKIKPIKQPEHCTGHICVDCIKCEHLAYAAIDDDLRKKLAKQIIDHEKEDEPT